MTSIVLPVIAVNLSLFQLNSGQELVRDVTETIAKWGLAPSDLEFDGKYFRPQPRMLALSGAYLGARSLPKIAQPFLKAARDELRESISLAVLDRDAALFVARAEAAIIAAYDMTDGARDYRLKFDMLAKSWTLIDMTH